MGRADGDTEVGDLKSQRVSEMQQAKRDVLQLEQELTTARAATDDAGGIGEAFSRLRATRDFFFVDSRGTAAPDDAGAVTAARAASPGAAEPARLAATLQAPPGSGGGGAPRATAREVSSSHCW